MAHVAEKCLNRKDPNLELPERVLPDYVDDEQYDLHEISAVQGECNYKRKFLGGVCQ